MGWRNGLVIGANGCGGLSDPYVLWDSRVWHSREAMGYGSRAMPNLGIGGPLWDLDVVTGTNWEGKNWTTARHPEQPGNMNDWPSYPQYPWSTVGGLPCEGPFTMMIAYGDFPGGPEGNNYAEIDFLFRSFGEGGGGSQYGLGQAIGYLAGGYDITSLGLSDVVDYSTFVASFHGYAYTQWNAPAVYTDGSASALFRNKLISVTVDSVDAKYHRAYRGSPTGAFKIPYHDNNDTQEEFFDYTTPNECAGFADSGEFMDGEHFFFLGEDFRTGLVQPGTPWTGVVGAALFRGCPSGGDIDYWHNYFYESTPDPLPVYVNPFSYTGSFGRWTDGTYAYYEFREGGTFTPIPGRSLPSEISIFMVGGGGGSAGFQSPAGGGGGGGGELIQAVVSAPVASRAFVLGAGGTSRTNGGNSTFMGYTARGGRGATSSTGGAAGNLTAGGTRLLAERAGAGGGSHNFVGRNVAGTLTGRGAFGIVSSWALGGGPLRYGSGGNGGGNIGSVTQASPDGSGGSNNNPAPRPNSGSGAGGRISSSATQGFTAAAGTLLIRHLVA